MPQPFILKQPDDWHIHLREAAVLPLTLKAFKRIFNRCLAMPNLQQPITSLQRLRKYREQIQAIIGDDHKRVQITMYLTNAMTTDLIAQCAQSGEVIGFKLYPAGATTNSNFGVNNIKALYPVLEAMQQYDIPLLIHGEVVDAAIDIFDRERVFIERHLQQIVAEFPNLRIVLEHITTADAVNFVRDCREKVVATITPQHLMLNRNDLLVGGIKPHNYCLPILKRNTHQQALLKAAFSGSPKFFLGTDSAPHFKHLKESACGCAGCFSGLHALELYAEVFHQHDQMDKLENFASIFGAQFYQLPITNNKVALYRQPQTIPQTIAIGNETITPFLAGHKLQFTAKLVEN